MKTTDKQCKKFPFIFKFFGVIWLLFFCYLLLYPLYTPKEEKITCNSKLECIIEQRYFYCCKTKNLKLSKYSYLTFETEEYYDRIRRLHIGWCYYSTLTIIDKNQNRIKPFDSRTLYSEHINTTWMTDSREEYEKEHIKKLIKEKNDTLYKQFRDYIEHPEKGFELSRKSG